MATEDLTTYTEVDPRNDLSVSVDRVTYTVIHDNTETYLYEDKGVGYFDGNFTHELTVHIGSFQYQFYPAAWQLSNHVAAWRDHEQNGWPALALRTLRSGGGDYKLVLDEIYPGGPVQSDPYATTPDTTYYLTIERDVSAGANGELECRIYSDGARTLLLDTLSLTLVEDHDFQYIYAFASRNGVNDKTGTGWNEDFDLHEVPPPVPRSHGYIIG